MDFDYKGSGLVLNLANRYEDAFIFAVDASRIEMFTATLTNRQRDFDILQESLSNYVAYLESTFFIFFSEIHFFRHYSSV